MTVQICFTADDDLVADLNKLAEKSQRSRSDLCNMLLKRAVKMHEPGRIVDFSEVIENSGDTGLMIKALLKALTPEQRKKAAEAWMSFIPDGV